MIGLLGAAIYKRVTEVSLKMTEGAFTVWLRDMIGLLGAAIYKRVTEVQPIVDWL